MPMQVQLILDTSAFDYQLVYYQGTLNFSDSPSLWLDYQRHANLEDLTIDNAFFIQRILMICYLLLAKRVVNWQVSIWVCVQQSN